LLVSAVDQAKDEGFSDSNGVFTIKNKVLPCFTWGFRDMSKEDDPRNGGLHNVDARFQLSPLAFS
jgi:hypothetical protein